MQHPNEFPFLLHEWKNQIQEDGPRRCAYIKRGCISDCRDINNALMWIVH